MDFTDISFGHNLKVHRAIHKLTQAGFAEQVSRALGRPVSQVAVSQWERGQRAPSYGQLLAIQHVLNYDDDQLVDAVHQLAAL